MGPFIEPKHPHPEPVAQPIPNPRAHRGRWVGGNTIACRSCGWESDATAPVAAIEQWRRHRNGPVTPPVTPVAVAWHTTVGMSDDERLICACGWVTDSIDAVGPSMAVFQMRDHQHNP